MAVGRTQDPHPAWLGALVEQGIEAIVAFDDALKIRYANQEAVALLGHPLGGVVGRDVLDFVHPDDFDRAAANVSGVGLGARPDPGLLRLRRGDGTWIDYELRPRRIVLAPPPDGPGNLTAVTLRDKTMEDSHWLFLAQLASGADFHESLEAFTRGLSSFVDGPMAVTYEADGQRRTCGTLPLELTWPDPVPPGSPWERALHTGEAAWSPVEALDPPERAMAERLGIGALVVVAVHDPSHRSPALLVQGPYAGNMGEILMTALSRRPLEALTIALDRRHAMERLHELALSDPLTGLANRAYFFEALTAMDKQGTDYTVCYVDLDRFKEINDSHGHLVGDEILVESARRMKLVSRPGDVVARLGGDEFAVACPGVGGDASGAMADRLVATLNDECDIGGFVFDLGASVGVATNRPGQAPGEVVAAADQALYAAKGAGRGAWRRAGDVGESV